MSSVSIVEVLSHGAEVLGPLGRVADGAERLVSRGRISRPDVAQRRVAAYVSDRGGARFRARIELATDGVRAACTCGRSNGSPCRHTTALAMLWRLTR